MALRSKVLEVVPRGTLAWEEDATAPPLPHHDELVHDLRRLRERGLLRIRELELPALSAVTARLRVGPTRSEARAAEGVLRSACDRLGDDDFGHAARTLFGLVQGTIGHSPTDLRERAAAVFDRSAETFRKHQERLIVARLADELLILADVQEPRAATGATPGRPTVGVPGGPGALGGAPRRGTHFAGRESDIAAVTEALVRRRGDAGSPSVCVIHGMAGVGKTALALEVTARLGDGTENVLVLDLHGGSVAGPEDPADLLERLLRRMGVVSERIPSHVDDRKALWSEVASSRRMILVLDDARDAGQVVPLLPAAAWQVLVTSRDRLVGLDEAVHVRLGVMPRRDGVLLLATVAGLEVPDGDGLADEPLSRVAERCGDLPLALRIAAARLRADPHETVESLLDRLSGEHGRLAELDDGRRSVSASLRTAVEALAGPARAAFMLFGQFPELELTPEIAAALLDRPVHRGRHILDALFDRHLIDRVDAQHYRFHDLVSQFAREEDGGTIEPDEVAAATRRLGGYMLSAVSVADEWLNPYRARIEPPAAGDAVALGRLVRRPADALDALDWIRREEANAAAVCLMTGDRGADILCWQLAYALRGWFFIAKRWTTWLRTHEAALAATRRLGDRRAEATTLRNLGLANLEQERIAEATERFEEARLLFHEVGDADGAHNTLVDLAWVAFARGRYAGFRADMRTALDFYAATGNRRNAAITGRGLALGLVASGRSREAVALLRDAVTEFRALGLEVDRVVALNNLGIALTADGDLSAARRAHEEALAGATGCGSTFEAARAEAGLGKLAAAGDPAAAERHLATALEAYERLGAPQAERLRSVSAPAAAPGC
jgi:tetratricopeptide (TPR) repeat protein